MHRLRLVRICLITSEFNWNVFLHGFKAFHRSLIFSSIDFLRSSAFWSLWVYVCGCMKKEIDICQELSYHDYISPKYLEALFLFCWIKNNFKTSKAVMSWNYTLKLHTHLPCDTRAEIQKWNRKDTRYFVSIFKKLVTLGLENTGKL